MTLSDFIPSSTLAGAEPVSVSALLSGGFSPVFRARFADGQEIDRPASAPASAVADTPDEPDMASLMEQARADAFAQGFDEGMRVAGEGLAVDEEAKARLAEALAQIAPAAQGALSALLSAAVLRLVTQIAGEVAVDPVLLTKRVDAVAAFLEEEQGRKSLYMHPEDIALLSGHEFGFTLTPDPQMGRGSVRLDTSEGWIEDGPDVQISRLKAVLGSVEEQG